MPTDYRSSIQCGRFVVVCECSNREGRGGGRNLVPIYLLFPIRHLSFNSRSMEWDSKRQASERSGKRCQTITPKNNLQQHISCFRDPSYYQAALKSGCLYSLPGQNPAAAGDPLAPPSPSWGTIPVPDQAQVQLDSKAWAFLVSSKGRPREFLQPGVSAPVSIGQQGFGSASQATSMHG
eukprot:TRINITY_DN9700_c0_g1_i1.p1 TRINITY_DN9700_c0_g1~~TRINITY_DN9700_c0_g1_i1.p1  ORF type:complete len:179 (+),score=10.69 TRINITY_DN9700_c0_g1_i1:23-559(+)